MPGAACEPDPAEELDELLLAAVGGLVEDELVEEELVEEELVEEELVEEELVAPSPPD